MDKFCSIIVTHFSSNNERKLLVRRSLETLVDNTSFPFELIVVDNGGNSTNNSDFFLNLVDKGYISTYVKNANNMHFGYARNQGYAMSHGEYICIADDDIEYQVGWLEECIKILDAYPDKKIYATPFDYPMDGLREKYNQGELELDGKRYVLNMRAGSNCFVVRREDYDEIGGFECHRIAGSHWTNKAVRLGYLACVLPGNYAKDLGLRKGYNLKQSIPIRKTLSNRAEIFFNTDEFKVSNEDKIYYGRNSCNV